MTPEEEVELKATVESLVKQVKGAETLLQQSKTEYGEIKKANTSVVSELASAKAEIEALKILKSQSGPTVKEEGKVNEAELSVKVRELQASMTDDETKALDESLAS